jgi:hypothetical protein
MILSLMRTNKLLKRFIKVTDGLYRGSAPSPEDVVNLHKYFGIQKIVSLDANVAQKIDKIVKALGIEHVLIPINERDPAPLITLMSQDLKDLLLKGGPTYVHCLAGKDRTGMVIAMVECKYLGVSCKDAIEEAIKLGFGIGLDPKTARLYIKIIKKYCNCNQANLSHDNNNADIVDNSRPGSDWRGSVLDSADLSSFAPYLDYDRQYPYDAVYDYTNQQYPTRNNKDLEKVKEEKGRETDIPLVGLYDNDAGVHGIGPVEPGNGFTGS